MDSLGVISDGDQLQKLFEVQFAGLQILLWPLGLKAFCRMNELLGPGQQENDHSEEPTKAATGASILSMSLSCIRFHLPSPGSIAATAALRKTCAGCRLFMTLLQSSYPETSSCHAQNSQPTTVDALGLSSAEDLNFESGRVRVRVAPNYLQRPETPLPNDDAALLQHQPTQFSLSQTLPVLSCVLTTPRAISMSSITSPRILGLIRIHHEHGT